MAWKHKWQLRAQIDRLDEALSVALLTLDHKESCPDRSSLCRCGYISTMRRIDEILNKKVPRVKPKKKRGRDYIERRGRKKQESLKLLIIFDKSIILEEK